MRDEEGLDEYISVNLPLRLKRREIQRLHDAAAGDDRRPHAGHLEEKPGRVEAHARRNAEAQLRVNRARASVVGTELFSDPSWNIMLDLFLRDMDGKLTTVTSACIGAIAPSTTALRHLSMLVDERLVGRRPSESDSRVVYVSLTEDGYARMLKLLS